MATATEFELLLGQHRGVLYKISRSYGRTPEDRDDLAQEIVVQIWKSFGSWKPQPRFSTWMYRVALNVAISFSRRENTRQRHAAPMFDLASGESRSDEIRLLHEAIEKLDPLPRALMLLYLEGCSHEEIAEILGITKTNVATKISRITSAFRKQFTGEQDHGTR